MTAVCHANDHGVFGDVVDFIAANAQVGNSAAVPVGLARCVGAARPAPGEDAGIVNGLDSAALYQDVVKACVRGVVGFDEDADSAGVLGLDGLADNALDVMDVQILQVDTPGDAEVGRGDHDAPAVAAGGSVVCDFQVIDFPVLLVVQIDDGVSCGPGPVYDGQRTVAVSIYNNRITGSA